MLLKKIGSRGTGKNDFHYPRAVAVNTEGDIAVADTSNNRVKVYTQVNLDILLAPPPCTI